MKLDYNPGNGQFILSVRRGEGPTPQDLMKEHGLTFWPAAGTVSEAVMSTQEPYAAAAFAEFATPLAYDKMKWICDQVALSRAPTSARHFDVPDDKELWDFQKADLEYMLARQHSLDADEPGLGKTPTAIAYANEIQARRVLVICPASIRFQWVRRAMEWSTMGRKYKVPDQLIYAITSAKGGVHPTAAWTVVSYELARHVSADGLGILPALRKGRYDLLILDEAHYLKTTGSRRTRAVFGGGADPNFHEALAEKAEHVVALTGTPLPNRPREAYVMARNLCFDAIDYASEERFGERFNPIEFIEREKKDPETGETRIVRITNEESGRHTELQNRLRANFMTRHLKREVMTDLKYPLYDLIYADLDDRNTGPAIRAALRAEKLLDIDPDTLAGADATVLGHIAEARRLMGEALAPQACRYAEMLLDGGVEKLVIFYWHHSVGAILHQHLHKYGLERVDGNTTPVVKDAKVQKFISDPTCRVIAGNVMSLGTGTDGLQFVCGHALLAEADWTPGNNQQCIDRLDRGGQTRTVQADIMVAPGSIAERVLAGALRKLRVTTNALDRRVLA